MAMFFLRTDEYSSEKSHLELIQSSNSELLAGYKKIINKSN